MLLRFSKTKIDICDSRRNYKANGGRLDWSKEDNTKRVAEILTEFEVQAKGGFNFII